MINFICSLALGFCLGFFLAVYALPNGTQPIPTNSCYVEPSNPTWGRWEVHLKNGYILRPAYIKLDTCNSSQHPLLTPYLYELSWQVMDTFFFVPDSLGADTLPDWDNMPR